MRKQALAGDKGVMGLTKEDVEVTKVGWGLRACALLDDYSALLQIRWAAAGVTCAHAERVECSRAFLRACPRGAAGFMWRSCGRVLPAGLCVSECVCVCVCVCV